MKSDSIQILEEKTRLLYDGLPISQIALLVNSFLYAYLEKPVLDNELLRLWLYANCTLITVRFTFFGFFKVKNNLFSFPVWYAIFNIFALMSGVLWSLISLILFPSAGDLNQLFAIFLIAGMSASSVTTLSVSSVAITGYLILVVWPLAYRFYSFHSEIYTYMSLITIMSFFLVLFSSVRMRRNTLQNIQLRMDSVRDQKKIKDSEQRLKSLFDTTPLGILNLEIKNSKELLLVACNPGAVKMIDKDLYNLYGKNVNESIPFLNPKSTVEKIIHTSQSGENWHEEDLYLQNDGVEKYFELNAFRTGINQVSVIFSDVSNRKKTEKQLLLAKKEAEQANQAKTIFLSNMSHELRTPLNAINGFAQLLKMDKDLLTTEHNRYADEILKAGGHLLSLINEILDLSRVESGNMEISKVRTSIPLIIMESISFVDSRAKNAGINILFHSEDCPEINIETDPFRLKQIIMNLLSNAVKYNRRGGYVSIACELKQNSVIITVKDNGTGIPETKQHEIFKPFSRLSEDRTIEGSGIGLVIVKNITEFLGGKTGFRSVYGEGSEFWIELPVS